MTGQRRLRRMAMGLVLACLAAGTVWASVEKPHFRPASFMHFEAYEPQKAVYHVTGKGGWFNRDYLHLLAVLQNHINAVGEGFLDLRIVMQGDGLDLLIAARKDAKIANAIDRLRKQGARFEVCYNSLLLRQLDPDNDLYGLERKDIVSAGVAEVTHLVGQGFVYLRI